MHSQIHINSPAQHNSVSKECYGEIGLWLHRFITEVFLFVVCVVPFNEQTCILEEITCDVNGRETKKKSNNIKQLQRISIDSVSIYVGFWFLVMAVGCVKLMFFSINRV